MKLESDLRADFMAEMAVEVRQASNVIREVYTEQRNQEREYEEYLRRKVEVGRASMRDGRRRSNHEVETAFAAKRS